MYLNGDLNGDLNGNLNGNLNGDSSGDFNGNLNRDLHREGPAENQETKSSQTASSYDLIIALAKIGVIVMYAFLCDR